MVFSDLIQSSSHFQVLEADSNNLENLEGVYQLPKLEEVLLRNNSILACVNLLIPPNLGLGFFKACLNSVVRNN